MPLVAIDSNIIDLIAARIDAYPPEGELAEALEPPPSWLTADARAMYWLLALAPYWRSCVYTFSDLLYGELLKIPAGKHRWLDRLAGVALEIREEHPPELRTADPQEPPLFSEITGLGIHEGDARHVADAIRMLATHFLTCDRRLLRKAGKIKDGWGLDVMSPWEFLLWSVRAGALWPATVPSPWEDHRPGEGAG